MVDYEGTSVVHKEIECMYMCISEESHSPSKGKL